MVDTRFQTGREKTGGRTKKLKTQVKDWIKDNPGAVGELLQKLYERGMDGDKDCAIYVIDRIQGRPRQSLDARVSKEIILTADDYELIAQLLASDTKLITEGKNGQDSEGQDEALQGQEA